MTNYRIIYRYVSEFALNVEADNEDEAIQKIEGEGGMCYYIEQNACLEERIVEADE